MRIVINRLNRDDQPRAERQGHEAALVVMNDLGRAYAHARRLGAKVWQDGAIHRPSRGRPPYGWRHEDHELVPVPEEQEVIDRIVALRESGESWPAIAQKLGWHSSKVRRVHARATARTPHRRPR